MKKAEQVISYLNKLLILNCKTEKVFLDALDQIDNIVLKNFFRVSGYERNQFIRLLDSNIRQKGGTPLYPEDSLEPKSDLSSNIKNIISTKDEQSLFKEIGRINVSDIEEYQKVLDDFEFSEAIEQLLKNQLDTIVKSLYSIEVHKDLFAKKIVSFD